MTLIAGSRFKAASSGPAMPYSSPCTLEEADRYAFKTPTLRKVAMTGPYMNYGSVSTPVAFAFRRKKKVLHQTVPLLPFRKVQAPQQRFRSLPAL